MELSSLIQTESSSLSHYFSQAAKHRLLTADEEKALAKKIKKGCSLSREQLILCNLRLVIKIAKTYQNRGVSLLDLIEEGNLGVIRAADGFDETQNNRFSTYAGHWIRHFLENAIREKSGTVRLPDEVYNYALKVKKITDANPSITDEELADELNISRNRLRNIVDSPRIASSISQPAKEGVSPFTIPIETNYEEIILEPQIKDIVRELLEHVSERDAYILNARFGLDGNNPKKLEDIGNELGISRERVRQVEKNVLRKMKAYLSEENINFDDLLKD